MEGKVKFFKRVKGLGFITGDNGKDYFVHYSGITPGTFIREGDVVSFDGSEGDRGLKAENVTLLKKASELAGSGSSPAAPQEADNEEAEEESEDSDEDQEE